MSLEPNTIAQKLLIRVLNRHDVPLPTLHNATSTLLLQDFGLAILEGFLQEEIETLSVGHGFVAGASSGTIYSAIGTCGVDRIHY